MFCTNCGKQIDDDSKFCTFCGKEVNRNSIIVDVQEKELTEAEVPNIKIAGEVQETLPVIDVEIKKNEVESKYDETYEKDTMPTVVGCIMLFIWLIVYISSLGKQYETYEEYQQAQKTQGLLAVFNLALRIGVTIWIQNIARFRNRQAVWWGLFGFFFPAIALIFIGQKKKLKPKLKA